MRDRNSCLPNTLVVFLIRLLFLLVAGIGAFVQAQNQEPMIIQATAMGTSTQIGKMVNVNFILTSFLPRRIAKR
jgi:hypothetical protein